MSPPLCRHLRWKGRYGVTFRTEDDLRVSLATSGVPFTCLRTCMTVGPDDGLVTPEGCAPPRACFEGASSAAPVA